MFARVFIVSLLFASSLCATFNNPVVGGADPFITYADGQYRLLHTNMRNDITIISSPTINGLKTAPWVSIYQNGRFFESPELWFFEGHWYIYFTDYPNSVKVLQSSTADPSSSYTYRATLTGNTYDCTILKMPGNKTYLAGSTYGNIVIQELNNPTSSNPKQSAIGKMDQAWEHVVIEAPEFLFHGNDLFMIYTSGGYQQANYAVGAYKFVGQDPMDPAAWKKLPGPLFTQDTGAQTFAAGVTSPFYAADKSTVYFTYSAYDVQGAANRDVRVQPLSWDANGPVFGKPILFSQPINEP